MSGQQAFLKSDGTNQLKKEGLARSVFADNKTDAGAAIGNTLQIADQRPNFLNPTDLNVLEAQARDNARRKGLQDGVSFPGPDAHLGSFRAHCSNSFAIV
jgi:hypothetical protein